MKKSKKIKKMGERIRKLENSSLDIGKLSILISDAIKESLMEDTMKEDPCIKLMREICRNKKSITYNDCLKQIKSINNTYCMNMELPNCRILCRHFIKFKSECFGDINLC